MRRYRYSEWDGSQDFAELDKDMLMDELARNLMHDGNMNYSLWRMQRQGLRDARGRRLPGLQELLQRLRQRRQAELERYRLGSIMDEIRQRLDDIISTERRGIERRLEEARRQAAESPAQSGQAAGDDLGPEMRQKLLERIEQMAGRNLAQLDNLPDDVGGKVKELTSYDFMDEEARDKFQQLIEMLKRHASESFARDLTSQLRSMDPEALASLRHLTEAINQLLEQRLRGEEPDFDEFMQQFGDFFGPERPGNLDELIERLQQQMAQAQSLLDSLSAKDRRELEELLGSVLDDATQMELARLAANLDTLSPDDSLQRRYEFTGQESLSFSEALRLMEELQQMDQLERQLKEAQYSRDLDTIDEQKLREILGDEAAEDLERLRNITRILEEAGYIQRQGNRFELTPRGMRKIGQKALKDVFSQLKKDRLGTHSRHQRGTGTERIDETKPYEFGDRFDVNLEKTIMNAIYRERPGVPLRLKVDDFEVYRSEELTRSATVLMIDLSLSMPMRGNFQAAKQVAIALDGLIRSQYPRDSLHIIGFSSYARVLKRDDLPYMGWDEFDPYTNIQHGLQLARQLLARERCNNKQILLVSDGEPTSHLENGHIYFQYPPSLRTIQLTLREVRNCTRQHIVINTFMLGQGGFLNAFVTQVARINKGRIFYTSADTLGEYMLVDYLSNKRRRLE